MPRSYMQLAANRTAMTDEMQALCFFAGVNSIFVGDTLLLLPAIESQADRKLFNQLGLAAL